MNFFVCPKIFQKILTAETSQRLWVLQADESTSATNIFDKNKVFFDEIELQKNIQRSFYFM